MAGTVLTTFKELQAEWYAKLAASGFIDIERELDDARGYKRPFKDDLCKENYYRAVGHALQQCYGHLHARLMSDRQRIMVYVLERHSDGASTSSICLELQELGLRPHRLSTIKSWIKQFVAATGVRYHSPEELKKLSKW